ncbi:MAG: sulfatase [Halioglobus sp.]
MKRSRMVLPIGLLLVAAVFLTVRAIYPQQSRPNFIIIVADDLSWNDIGAYGNSDVYTPNIDELANNGMRFTGAFLTTSSCSASRASILTGKYPHANGLVNLHQKLPASESTLGQMLGAAGYYAAAAGKWHIGGAVKGQFDVVRDGTSDDVSSDWLQLLRNRPKDKPFFLWLAAHDPHRPHDRGAAFARHYDHPSFKLPVGYVDGKGLRRELLAYYLEVSSFDRDVGTIREELARQGILDDTFVLIMSDNGRPFPRGKLSLYDAGIKTPFIVHWPAGVTVPGDYSYLVSAVDIAPTLLELAGASVPADLQGSSFARVFADPQLKLRDYVFAERNWHVQPAHERAVRSVNFLYKENQYPRGGDCRHTPFGSTVVHKALVKAHKEGRLTAAQEACFADERPAVELFAVRDDGVNFQNLAEDTTYAPVRREMAAQLSEWRRSTGDFDFQPEATFSPSAPVAPQQ